jgi:acyl carrier protein
MSEPTVSDYENDTIEVLHELTQDWDTGFAGEISPSTAIVADLAFESLDVVHLITALEQRYEKSDFPFEEMLMVDDHYVEDLTVAQIARFVCKHSDERGLEGKDGD